MHPRGPARNGRAFLEIADQTDNGRLPNSSAFEKTALCHALHLGCAPSAVAEPHLVRVWRYKIRCTDREHAGLVVQFSRSAVTTSPPSIPARSDCTRNSAKGGPPREGGSAASAMHSPCDAHHSSGTQAIYLRYTRQELCPMKSSTSVDPASRSTGTYSPKIQEPKIRQMELASAPPSATSRIDSAPDPALSPLGRAPVRRSSGKTPGAPSADPEKGAQAFGVQPPASSSAAKAASAPQHPPSTSRVAQSHPEHASARSHPSRSTLGQMRSEITRSKNVRDLEMKFHKFLRRAGKHAKDLV